VGASGGSDVIGGLGEVPRGRRGSFARVIVSDGVSGRIQLNRSGIAATMVSKGNMA
jgi:hypothetical protein